MLQSMTGFGKATGEFEDKKITIEIEIEELPTLSEVKIKGIKKGRIESIISDTELTVGKKLSESFLTNTKNFIQNNYRNKLLT